MATLIDDNTLEYQPCGCIFCHLCCKCSTRQLDLSSHNIKDIFANCAEISLFVWPSTKYLNKCIDGQGPVYNTKYFDGNYAAKIGSCPMYSYMTSVFVIKLLIFYLITIITIFIFFVLGIGITITVVIPIVIVIILITINMVLISPCWICHYLYNKNRSKYKNSSQNNTDIDGSHLEQV